MFPVARPFFSQPGVREGASFPRGSMDECELSGESQVSANIRDILQGTPKTWERQRKTWFPSEQCGNSLGHSVEGAAKLFGKNSDVPPSLPQCLRQKDGEKFSGERRHLNQQLVPSGDPRPY